MYKTNGRFLDSRIWANGNRTRLPDYARRDGGGLRAQRPAGEANPDACCRRQAERHVKSSTSEVTSRMPIDEPTRCECRSITELAPVTGAGSSSKSSLAYL